MGEEFHASIKLVSGEELFSLVSIDENDGDPILILQNPVIMKILENPYGTMVKIKPWMQIPEDQFFILKLDKIITMTEINDDKVIGFYSKYLNDDPNDDIEELEGKVKITNKMGYVSSVEEARKFLEKIFKEIKES
jgi:hypothetical protein